jgi:hypothetical protein
VKAAPRLSEMVEEAGIKDAIDYKKKEEAVAPSKK